MEQEEITKVYETLAPMAGNYLNAQAEQIGQAQQSMGPLAAATMGQSKTAGLGNYTYNRLMRPQVETMRDELMVQGYANQLNRLLSDALNKAKKNYGRRSSGGKSNDGSGNNGTTGVTKIGGVDDVTTSGGVSSVPIIPNKYSYELEDGTMKTVERPPMVSNDEWMLSYNRDKAAAAKNGRKFING